MKYTIRISERAEMEIKKAEDWYESQAPGLGKRFTSEIKEEIDSLLNPHVEHRLVFKILRRLLVHRFPYTIYYVRDEKIPSIEVISVLHNKQSKEELKGRI